LKLEVARTPSEKRSETCKWNWFLAQKWSRTFQILISRDINLKKLNQMLQLRFGITKYYQPWTSEKYQTVWTSLTSEKHMCKVASTIYDGYPG